MRDFADVPNAVGTFPDVTAIDCSGPGTTDGTADIADTLTDDWGWKQALLNDQGITPDDTAEADGDSQILDAIKLLITPRDYHNALWIPELDGSYNPSWRFVTSAGELQSLVDNADAVLPLNLPIGTVDTTITLRVEPGDARSGTDRMRFGLYYKTTTGSPILIGSLVYDNASASEQNIVITNNSLSVVANRVYYVRVIAGDDGGSHNVDDILATHIDVSFS